MKKEVKMETIDSIFKNAIDWGGGRSRRGPCEEDILEYLIRRVIPERIIVRGRGGSFHGAELTDIGWHYGLLMRTSAPEIAFFADEYKEYHYREDPSLRDEGEIGDEFRGHVAFHKSWERYALDDFAILEKLKDEYLVSRKKDGIVEIYWKNSGEDFYHEYFYRDENLSAPGISE